MKTIIVRNRNQATLPKEMLEDGVHEFEFKKLENGSFLLIPLVAIPASQRYFWTRRWQAGETKANEDLAHGRYKDFDNVEDLISDLEAGRRNRKRARK